MLHIGLRRAGCLSLVIFASVAQYPQSANAGESSSLGNGTTLLTTLSESQMDVVTAGTVVVLVAAEAHATGDTAYTSTTTGTLTVARPGGVVEQGFGVGDAVASSDTHQVNVYTDGYGDGDIVAVARTGNDVVNPMFSRERDG